MKNTTAPPPQSSPEQLLSARGRGEYFLGGVGCEFYQKLRWQEVLYVMKNLIDNTIMSGAPMLTLMSAAFFLIVLSILIILSKSARCLFALIITAGGQQILEGYHKDLQEYQLLAGVNTIIKGMKRIVGIYSSVAIESHFSTHTKLNIIFSIRFFRLCLKIQK